MALWKILLWIALNSELIVGARIKKYCSQSSIARERIKTKTNVHEIRTENTFEKYLCRVIVSKAKNAHHPNPLQ